MEARPTASRPRGLERYRLIGAAAAVVLVAVLAADAIQPSVLPTASLPSDSYAPASPGPTATQTPESWQPLALAPYSPDAELTAARSNASGVATDTTFILRSHGSAPAVDLARGLVSTPSLELQAASGATANSAVIRPKAPLAPGARYRFRLTGLDGTLIGSWSFRVAGPLHVTGLLPDDRTTGVPTSTGIEVTFDQDAATGFAEHFTIKPAVAGRFEQHDRTWVFVPTKPLTPGTLYTYTVRAGVGQTGSDETLEHSVTASFETAAVKPADTQMAFDRPLFDVRTGTRPLLGLWIGTPSDSPVLASLPIQLYRLPTIDAAASAAARLATQDDWLLESAAGLIDPAGLTRVGSFTAPLTDHAAEAYVMHVPAVLDPGWYLLVVPRTGRDAQTVLQVTDLATYAVSSFTRTVAWVNDLATGGPVRDATVAIAGGPSLGRTDSSGLLDAATPGALFIETDDWQRVRSHGLTIRASGGRAAIAILGLPSRGHYPYNYIYEWGEPNPWWSVFAADRQTYRTTDTIHAYGFVRSTADRSVPASLELQLGLSSADAWSPIVTRAVAPTARGSFVADLPIRDLPLGGYELRLYAGGKLVATQWLSVDVIRKPAYSIALTTDHRAYRTGQKIAVSAAVSFYDGTTAPGLELNVGAWSDDRQSLVDPARLTTNAQGTVSRSMVATAKGPDGWTDISLGAVPTHPEEGSIQGEAQVVVFPSDVWVAGTGEIRAGHLQVSGTVSQLDLAAVDRQLQLGRWDFDPAGAGLAGKTLSVKVIHYVPVRRLLRTEYDYLEKRAIPIYEYDSREVVLGTYQVRSGTAGSFALSVAVPSDHDSYRADVDARDAAGRLTRTQIYAWSYERLSVPSDLQVDLPANATVGQSLDVSVRRADGASPAGKFLFLIARDGIREVVLSDTPSLRRTFADGDLPGFDVRAVRLSATGLQVATDGRVLVEPDSRRLGVTLTPDRKRYAPGDSVTIQIRTTGPDGRPTAADVVVRAVDQKLFAIGAAWEEDHLWELLRFGGAGILQSFTSAFVPRVLSEGGGGGGGGGGRADFRDAATFQLVSTDASGSGRVTFTLPDDLTSWHVSATAFTGSLQLGEGVAIVPVGLPMFTEAVLAPDYLVGEAPVLRVRAYGESLHAGDPVQFTVSAPTLGLIPTVVRGVAFEAIRIPLPALPAGDHQVTIAAVRIGDPSLRDEVVRTVHVIPNRLTVLRTSYLDLNGSLEPPSGVGATTYLVTDAGRGALVPILNGLAAGGGARFDRLAAAVEARSLLTTAFQVPLEGLASTGFDPSRYQEYRGVAILPYASPDLALGTKAAFTVPGLLDRTALRTTFTNRINQATSTDSDVIPPTRLELIVAHAGLAALGDDVIDDLRTLAATEPALTLPEQLWLALGYLASGDENAAREIERQVLATTATRLGPWVRLDEGQPNDADGLMLLLAGGLGDPVAAQLSRYLIDRRSMTNLYALEQLGYVRAMLDRLPRAAASFAWTVDGQRHVQTLEPGGSWSIRLTPDQQRSLHLERLTGALTLTTSAIVAPSPGELPSTPGLTITRTVSPPSGAVEDQVVHVTIQVAFHGGESSGSYTVTDLVPSGLAPIATTADWPCESCPTYGWRPFEVAGQRVSWSIDPSHNPPLVYTARVVSPGTCAWEPAVVQYDPDPSVGAATVPTTYTIR